MRSRIDELTSKAFAEWIGGCVPSKDRRSAFLARGGCTPEEAIEITRRCDSSLAAAEDYLWAGSIPDWSEQNNKKMVEAFVARFPWIDAEAHSALLRFVGWMGWHEGLIKQGAETK
jgi:hypothetical protein